MEFRKLLCLFCSYNRSLAVNCRWIPRQLTAAGSLKVQQLTAAGVFSSSICVFQPNQMCIQQFSSQQGLREIISEWASTHIIGPMLDYTLIDNPRHSRKHRRLHFCLTTQECISSNLHCSYDLKQSPAYLVGHHIVSYNCALLYKCGSTPHLRYNDVFTTFRTFPFLVSLT